KYIEEIKKEIETFFYENYSIENGNSSILKKKIYMMISEKYSWMNEKNKNRTYSQGMYFAWHG
ncbi:hypothetical protein, partial [Fusobacterium necrophorum]|uniref:hypothetical protein n=1 Tax=Fusobacterium necrophorum TaxID=859 RepID=UPI001C9C0B6B